MIPVNQSQTIRKLKPTKSPSTPPMSATRDPTEKASSSLKTWTEAVANIGTKNVPLSFSQGDYDERARQRCNCNCVHSYKDAWPQC